MLYALLIYGEEGVFERLSEEEQEAVMEKHRAVQREYDAKKALGPVAKLMGTAGAMTVRKQGDSLLVLDGPYTETKEHLLGLYLFEFGSMEEAIEAAKKFPQGIAAYEVRPVEWAGCMGRFNSDG